MSNKEKINDFLGLFTSYYIENISARLIKDRGLIFSNRELFSHKWSENNLKYDFCLKCGCPKHTQYYSDGCPVSIKAFNTYPFIKHKYKTTKIELEKNTFFYLGYFKKHKPKEMEITSCIKCGLIPEREKIFYRLDKNKKNAYIVNTPVGSKKRYIHCNLTDEEFDVRDIII